MSSRGYAQRKRERLERLRQRVEFLAGRIAAQPNIDCRYDKAERSALLWAIEEIERWDLVAEVIEGEQPDAEKVATLRALLRSRLSPSADDLARTPGLVRAIEENAARRAEYVERMFDVAQPAASVVAEEPPAKTDLSDLSSSSALLGPELRAVLEDLHALSQRWGREAHEIDQDGDFCCAHTRRNDAGELHDLLRKHKLDTLLLSLRQPQIEEETKT